MCWTSDIYTEKTPDFRRIKYSLDKRSLNLFLLYPWKNEKFNQNVIHWTITLITPLFRIVHFKTNYNYRLSNHCFINELILVTYALISDAVEKNMTPAPWLRYDSSWYHGTNCCFLNCNGPVLSRKSLYDVSLYKCLAKKISGTYKIWKLGIIDSVQEIKRKVQRLSRSRAPA